MPSPGNDERSARPVSAGGRGHRALVGLSLVSFLVVLCSCSGGGSGGSEVSSSPTPAPTPSTVAQEDALAARIPLEGGALVSLRWKLPGKVSEDVKAPLLAARRLVAIDYYKYSTADPVRWFNTVLSVQELEPDDIIYQSNQELEPQPWSERGSGPVWIWVMDIKKRPAGTVDVMMCHDPSWSSKVRLRKNTRAEQLVRVDTVTVSLLKHYPDGQRWKVTDYNPLSGDPVNRSYTPSCVEWAKAHTTMGGWTLPPESSESSEPTP